LQRSSSSSRRERSVATALLRGAAGQIQKRAGDLVHCERAALGLMEAEGDAPWI